MFGITKSHHSQSLEVENGSRKLSNLKAVNSESICFCEFWFCFRENVLRKIHTNSLTPTYTHNTLTATHTAQHVHTHTHTQSQAHTNTHTTITHTQKKPNMYTHTHTSSTHTHTHIKHTHTHQAHTHTQSSTHHKHTQNQTHWGSTHIAVEVPQSAGGQEAFEIHTVVQKQLNKVSTVLNKCCEHGVIQLCLLKGDQD